MSPQQRLRQITLTADSLSAGPLCDTPSKSVTPPCPCDGHHGWAFTFLCNKDLSCLESVSKSTQSNAAFVVGSFVSGMAIILQINDLLVQFFPDAQTLYHVAQMRSSRCNFPKSVSDARYRLAHIFQWLHRCCYRCPCCPCTTAVAIIHFRHLFSAHSTLHVSIFSFARSYARTS